MFTRKNKELFYKGCANNMALIFFLGTTTPSGYVVPYKTNDVFNTVYSLPVAKRIINYFLFQ